MAYLNGLQDHLARLGGSAGGRTSTWPSCSRLADRAGLLRDPDMARRRMVRVLAVHRDRLMPRAV